MWEAIAAAIGVLGTLGGLWLKRRHDVEGLQEQHAREDHSHRQSYYHDLQVSAASLIDLTWHTPPESAAGVQQVVEGQFRYQAKGVRTFGSPAARTAARELEEAWDRGDETVMRESLDRLEATAVDDVGPK